MLAAGVAGHSLQPTPSAPSALPPTPPLASQPPTPLPAPMAFPMFPPSPQPALANPGLVTPFPPQRMPSSQPPTPSSQPPTPSSQPPTPSSQRPVIYAGAAQGQGAHGQVFPDGTVRRGPALFFQGGGPAPEQVWSLDLTRTTPGAGSLAAPERAIAVMLPALLLVPGTLDSPSGPAPSLRQPGRWAGPQLRQAPLHHSAPPPCGASAVGWPEGALLQGASGASDRCAAPPPPLVLLQGPCLESVVPPGQAPEGSWGMLAPARPPRALQLDEATGGERRLSWVQVRTAASQGSPGGTPTSMAYAAGPECSAAGWCPASGGQPCHGGPVLLATQPHGLPRGR